MDRLLNAVTKLGSDVEIKIKAQRDDRAEHEGRMCLVTA
jgi:hypothetical protein